MCVGECGFRVFRSKDFDGWVVNGWRAKSDDITRKVQPNIQGKIQNLTELTKYVDYGNAISIYSGGVTHYGVCVGTREGNLLISHKYAEMGNMRETKIMPISRGVVRIDDLIDIINPSTKTEITIFACHTNIMDYMCRAAAVHKALYAEKDARYNLFYANCENFSVYCCTFFQTISTQVLQYGYWILGTLSPIFILITCLLWGFGLNESLFFAAFIYLAFYLGDPYISIYTYLKFSKWGVNSVQSKLAAMCEKLDLTLRTNFNENELIEKETNILRLFYYLCQHVAVVCGDDADERLKLQGAVCHFVIHYLPLKMSHILKLTESDVENDDVRVLLLTQLGQFLIDVKVFALALGEFQSNNFLTIIGCNILSAILVLLRLFDFVRVNGESSFWMEKQQFVQGFCNDLSNVRLDFSKLKGFENYQIMFVCLEIYWRLVFDFVSLDRTDQFNMFTTLCEIINDAKIECGVLCQNGKCQCPNSILTTLEPLYTQSVAKKRMKKKLGTYLELIERVRNGEIKESK